MTVKVNETSALSYVALLGLKTEITGETVTLSGEIFTKNPVEPRVVPATAEPRVLIAVRRDSLPPSWFCITMCLPFPEFLS